MVDPPDPEVVRRFLALPKMACAGADAVVRLAAGEAGCGRLRARRPGARVCGPAVTLRYRVSESASEDRVLGDREFYGLAPAGGVAVLDADGYKEHAVVGNVSVAWAGLADVTGVLVAGPSATSRPSPPHRLRV